MIELKNYNHIHCVGIGGVGLSAIAMVLLSQGYKITGSDVKSNDHIEKLIEKGAEVFINHDKKNIDSADLVVYSAAVSMQNPEIAEASRRGIQIATRAEVLGALMKEHEISIAISGTHGKTTTTSMVSLILDHAELSPTVLVGGNIQEFGSNVKIGKGPHFVTEACEYMDHFLSLKPHIEIILNVDSDHLDYFKDIEHISKSFEKFAKMVPKDGSIFAYEGNPFVSSIIKDLECNVITFGFNPKANYSAQNLAFDSNGMPSFDLYHNGEELGKISLSVPGEHNTINALAASACCHNLGVDISIITKTLSEFTGTQRRFDELGTTKSGLRIVDDYAHHPTEIKATLKAALNIRRRNLWCVFQPHTYTRTLALFDEFSDSFDDADKVILTDIYAAREKNIYNINSKMLYDSIKKARPDMEIYYIPDFDDICDFILENAEKGDLIMSMGAGDVFKIAETLLAKDS